MNKPNIFDTRRRLLLSLPLFLLLAGCGGGGSDSLPASTIPVIDSFTVNGTVIAETNTAPLVTIPTNSQAVLVCTAHDPTLNPILFTWTGLTDVTASTSGSSTITTTPVTDGNIVVTCTVSNLRGKSSSRTVTLHAQTTSTPTLSLFASVASVAPGGTVTLTALGTGSGTLTYQFSVIQGTGSVAQNTASPHLATFTASAATGANIVLCTLTDAQGNSRTATVTLNVQ